jgi:hypothetical protein
MTISTVGLSAANIFGLLFSVAPLAFISIGSYSKSNEKYDNSSRSLYLIGMVISYHKLFEFTYDYYKLRDKLNRLEWNISSYYIMLLLNCISSSVLYGLSFLSTGLWYEVLFTTMNLYMTMVISVNLLLSFIGLDQYKYQHAIYALIFGSSEGFLTLSSYNGSGSGRIDFIADIFATILSFACIVFYIIIVFRKNQKIEVEYYVSSQRGNVIINSLKAAIFMILACEVIIGVIHAAIRHRVQPIVIIFSRYIMSLALLYILAWLPHLESLDAYGDVLVRPSLCHLITAIITQP